MTVLVDTSAFLAHVNADDDNHHRARATFASLRDQPVVTNNYVVIETAAVVQNRHGIHVVRQFFDDVLPPIGVLWVDEDTHRTAVTAHLAAARRSVSLIDRVSFEVMRRRRIRRAFAYDNNFRRHGFELV